MPKQLLLGPQRPVANLGEAVDAAGFPEGPVAVISAGWQEAEGDIGDVHEFVRRPLVDLELYHRAEDLFAADAQYAERYRQRQDRLKELQRLYRLRLRHLTMAARQTWRADGDTELVAAELRHAVSQLRALDRHHLRRVRSINSAFDQDTTGRNHPAVAEHVAALDSLLQRCETVLITGGNVVVLLNRLRLFGLDRLLAGKHLIAWSAGAMVLSKLIVLYHDRMPEGRREPEVLGPGAGLTPDYVFLPDARRRLRTNDAVRIGLLCRRFGPARCVTLDSGAHVSFDDGRVTSAGAARSLTHSGRLARLKPA